VARLGWLHLSDLLIRARGSRLLQPEYREAFEQDLRKLHALSGPWDLVFISGNLTQTGSTRDFQLLNSTLESLWQYLRSLGSDPCLLVVPGDCDFHQRRFLARDEANPLEHPAARVRKALQQQADSPLALGIRSGLDAFYLWSTEWWYAHPSPLLETYQRGLLPGDFSTTVNAQGLKVGIVGLNSLFRNVPPDEPGSLRELGLAQLEAATVQSATQWALQHDLVMLVTHPPPSQLDPKSQADILASVVPPTHFALHLCGSGDGDAATQVTYDKQVAAIQAPSLFGLETLGGKSSHAWGYVAGSLLFDAASRTCQASLFPRTLHFTATGAVELQPDESVSHLEVDGALRLPLEPLFKFGSLQGTPGKTAQAPQAGPRILVSPQSLAPRRGNFHSAITPQGQLGCLETKFSALAWAPSGDTLAVGADGHLGLWKQGEGALRWETEAHVTKIQDLCFSPEGEFLASCSQVNLRFWNTADGNQRFRSAPLKGSSLSWASNGILAAGAEDGTLHILPLQHEPSSQALKVSTLNIQGFRRLAWSSDGILLASCGYTAGSLELWSLIGGNLAQVALGTHPHPEVGVLDFAWLPGSSSVLATACEDKTLRIMRRAGSLLPKLETLAVLEGHTDAVIGVAFSFDGRLLASMSRDGSVRLFRTDTWEEVAKVEELNSRPLHGRLAFSPTKHVLATMGSGGHAIQLWDIDIEALLHSQVPSTTVHTTSAKVVLVGEGRAGKSCLALRLAQDQYKELGATHGMQFWSLPTEPQRELILWDMGGQEEYRLVHQLFLRDATAALMVMEPGRGRAALDEVEGWDQRMLAQTGGQSPRKLLVGTKVDDEHAPVDPAALEHFAKQRGFTEYVLTSARTGRGMAELKNALSRAIDWGSIEKVSRPKLFQHLRQHIQALREARRVVLTFTELEQELRRSLPESFDPEALRAVVAQLARQGLVADTRMADGTRALILEVEQVERYAGSLILAARDNPHGVPALDMAKMLSATAQLPRLKPEERLRRDQELIVLDCVIQLLIEHGLCLRHEGLLIFPSLFRPTQSEAGAELPHAISLHYDFSGPIDNIYASLVTSLALSQRFGPVRLWEARAEFGRAGEDTSGVRRIQQSGQGARGHARLDVYFDASTPQATRELFVSFIEEHLRLHGVSLVEHLVITCTCGRVLPAEFVQARLQAGKTDILCPACENRMPLTPGAQQSQERNPELAGQLQALRTRIREQRSQSITETKVSMTTAQRDTSQQSTPLRILHLSDLHVGAGDDPLRLLQPLVDDLRDRQEGLDVERLDYLVISGDITNRAAPEEFERARELVSGLIQEFGLTAERCIIVPGNHDLHWDTEVYTFKKKRQVTPKELMEGRYREQGDGYMLRDDTKYPERFRHFSQHFYHPLLQKEYPLSPEQQCLPSLFSETRLQFFAMNSAWEIDEYFPERSSIHEGALARGLEAAHQQLTSAIQSGALAKEAQVLRLAVWHHPVTGNEKISADAFMEWLARANVRACLHGHVHEDRAALVNHLHPTQKVHIVGAGSFGAPTAHRPESVPRLFNLLEVERDLSRLRVHTRCLRKQGGMWEGWAVWPGATRGEKRTYYDVPLP